MDNSILPPVYEILHQYTSYWKIPSLYELQWWLKVRYILYLITPTNIGQISKPEKVSESARPEDSETVTGS